MRPEAIDHHCRAFDAVPFAAGAARSFVGTTLRDGGAPSHVVDDFRLVISELVANLVEHGDGAGFEVCVDLAGERWMVVVECTVAAAGPSLPDLHAWEVADPDRATGRGLGIVRALTDHVSVTTSDGRLTIACTIAG